MFNRAVIIGVGLIGGSLGLALKERKLAGEVVGAGRSLESLDLAVEYGAVDRAAELPGAVAGADLVIVATPVGVFRQVLAGCASYLEPGALVTDVGSTKAGVVRAASGLVPPRAAFVGGHPMAGSEVTGVSGADPYLFENAYYILTPTTSTPGWALESASALARGVGAIVAVMSPGEHDQAVAAVSHLPHLVAAALVNSVAGRPDRDKILPLTAGGFRDTTRIAAGNPEMWRDIFLSNRNAVLELVRSFRHSLGQLEEAVAAGDGRAIEEALEYARQVRSALSARGKGYLPALYEIVVTVPDKPGIIGSMALQLGEAGINISDIEILRVREGEGGTIRLAFATLKEQERAFGLLTANGIPARRRNS
jgi:prephenate dehydrogenase